MAGHRCAVPCPHVVRLIAGDICVARRDRRSHRGWVCSIVVLAISRRTLGLHTHAVLLNVLGLLDFVGAVGGGVLSGSSPIGILRGDVTTDILLELPLSMIPTFAVPFWIVLHTISLIKLRNPQAA